MRPPPRRVLIVAQPLCVRAWHARFPSHVPLIVVVVAAAAAAAVVVVVVVVVVVDDDIVVQTGGVDNAAVILATGLVGWC